MGNPYTWQNKREKKEAVFARLDRALAKHLWLNMYPNSFLQNFAIFDSDHTLILLNTSFLEIITNLSLNLKQNGFLRKIL